MGHWTSQTRCRFKLKLSALSLVSVSYPRHAALWSKLFRKLHSAEHRYGHWRMWPQALKHQHLAPAGDESSWKVPSYLLQKILWILCWFYGSYGTMPGGMSQIHLFTHLPGPGNAIPHGLRHQKVEDELGRMVAQRDLKFDTATLTWSWVTCGSDWGWKIHI